MPDFRKVKRCQHCGAILQSDSENEIGYISKEILNKYPDGLLFCNECYQTEISKFPKEVKLDDDFSNVLNWVKEKNGLIVYVVDLYSFEGSTISQAAEILKGSDVLVVANKRDLLPKKSDDNNLISYVKDNLSTLNSNIKDVVIVSSTTGYHIYEMYSKIIEISNNRDVFFIGASVTGKSTLISEFIKQYDNKTNRTIITYHYPNTNLFGFRIPISKSAYLYEIPGLPISNSVLNQVELSCIRKIVPETEILPKTLKLPVRNSLIIGGLALIELVDGKESNIEVFVNKGIQLKVTRNGESFFGSVINNKNLLQPTSDRFRSFADFDVYDIEIKENGDRDLGILGLGWIKFSGDNQFFRIFVPKGVYVYTSRSKIEYVK